jgi:hypothetical protein
VKRKDGVVEKAERFSLELSKADAMLLWEILARAEGKKPLEPLDPAEYGALMGVLGALERSDLDQRVSDWDEELKAAYEDGRRARREIEAE